MIWLQGCRWQSSVDDFMLMAFLAKWWQNLFVADIHWMLTIFLEASDDKTIMLVAKLGHILSVTKLGHILSVTKLVNKIFCLQHSSPTSIQFEFGPPNIKMMIWFLSLGYFWVKTIKFLRKCRACIYTAQKWIPRKSDLFNECFPNRQNHELEQINFTKLNKNHFK